MCGNTRILFDASLADFTTFGIGGRVRRLVITDDMQVLKHELAEGTTVIGCGSNLLVGDGGMDGTIVRFVSDLCDPKLISDRMVAVENGIGLYVSGAMRLNRLARYAVDNDLSGLEWAAGIPGSMGGAVMMNAGAHGKDIGDVLMFADILRSGNIERLYPKDLKLGYRTSDFDGIVIGAFVKLKRAESGFAARETARLLEKRRETQPGGKSAGSVYKAANGVPAYKYIVGAGLQGFKIGGAQISEKHANFIINIGGATAQDVIALMEKTEKEVYSKFGIALEREIKTIGRF